MLQGLIAFNRGLFKLRPAVQIWMAALLAVNMVAPLVFIQTREAQVVLVAMMASVAMMSLLTAKAGFTRIVGVGHAPWVPLLVYLWTRLAAHPVDTNLGLWLRALILLNAISIALDTADAIRYARGNRHELDL